MEPTHELGRQFLAHWDGPTLSAAEVERISDAIADAIERARLAWPAIHVEPERFVTALAVHAPRHGELAQNIAGLRAEDLWLATACAAGDSAALAAFEADVMPLTSVALRAMRCDAATVDDVRQNVREKLLVGDHTRGPRIADYAGRGGLARWVKATAVRTYLNSRRGKKREVPVSDEPILDSLAPTTDPQLQLLKQKYKAEFNDALGAAMNKLSNRDRALLRYTHIEGLNLEALGKAFDVSRATAHRWLTRAREALAAEVQRELSTRLNLQDQEFSSIRRLVQSQVDISLRRFLNQ